MTEHEQDQDQDETLKSDDGVLHPPVPFFQTDLGQILLTGAAAGAAIGAALPFLSIIRGATLGAGGLVLWRAFQKTS